MQYASHMNNKSIKTSRLIVIFHCNSLNSPIVVENSLTISSNVYQICHELLFGSDKQTADYASQVRNTQLILQVIWRTVVSFFFVFLHVVHS